MFRFVSSYKPTRDTSSDRGKLSMQWVIVVLLISQLSIYLPPGTRGPKLQALKISIACMVERSMGVSRVFMPKWVLTNV